jgi:Ca-activated chloride channel family protein
MPASVYGIEVMDMFMKSMLCVSIALLMSSPAFADGILIHIPPRDRHIPPSYLSIKSQRVNVTIQDQASKTVIDQVFINDTDRDLEATYLFPVPNGAAISSFAMWMNGKKIEGEVLKADEARRVYEDIVRRLEDPGLLEYAGSDLFRALVYPVPRRGEVRIEIAYDEVLRMEAGLVKYRYALKSVRFPSRPPTDFSLAVEIESSKPIMSLYSPSHEIDIERDRTRASCGFEEKHFRPDSDFLLYYTVAEEDFGAHLLTHRHPGEKGYFMLLLSPGKLGRSGKVLDKDVIFVIDKSGSMRGEKMEQAKGALRYCLKNLNPGDRFNIITFSTGAQSFQQKLVPVTRSAVSKALEFVESIEARGGTNIDKALRTALAETRSKNPRLVVFLTDGIPTAGETDMEDILENTSAANTAEARIFSFGVGFDVNTHLLDRISLENRGTVDYVIPGEDIEETISSFFIKASNPVLSDVTVDFPGVAAFDYYPDPLPDMFDGSQLVLFGRYGGSGSSTITLKGTADDGTKKYAYETAFPRANRENEFIPRLWASRKIAYLITEIRLRGETRELVDEVIALSKEHGIITPYTSFLITEKGSDDDRRWIMPHSDAMAPAMKEAGDGLAMKVGREAVMLDKRISEEKAQTVLERPEISSVKYVGRKTFYRSGDAWVDAAYDTEVRAIEIRLWGASYFEMIRKHPELGEIFALGESVIFVFEGKAFRILK